MTDDTRLQTAKSDYYDKEQAFVAEFDALEKRKQDALAAVKSEQADAERRFALKVAPLQKQIADIEAAQQQLHNAFAAWAQEQKARIAVLGEATDGTSRD